MAVGAMSASTPGYGAFDKDASRKLPPCGLNGKGRLEPGR